MTDQTDSQEQPVKDSAEQTDWQTFSVNGQDMTADKLLDSYNNLQKEFTKKSQKLSDYEKLGSNEKAKDLTKDQQDIISSMKDLGFPTMEDLKSYSQKANEEIELRDILAANPELWKYEKVLRGLKTNKNSWEDVIDSYGLYDVTKIKKAKMPEIVGEITPKKESERKSVMNMNDKEYQAYKSKMNIDGSNLMDNLI